MISAVTDRRYKTMPANPPTIYVIAGCNGAGKTTFAKEFLPKEVKCLRFLNADEIARGLSPLKPSAGAVRAARLLLTQVDECLRRRETFALESTLSGKTYIRLFQRARKLGYEIELHYLWLSSPAQAVARVRLRVKQGGHHVPAADIRRRFRRSLEHLTDDYLSLADRWAVWDSRSLPAKRLAISAVDDIKTVRTLIGP
jgi:predicted ABC-type ATPase